MLDFAWRIPFIIGGLFGAVSVYLRRFLSETPIFKQLAARKALEKNIPVVAVIKNHKAACLLVGLITWSLSTTVMVGVLITPSKILGGMYGFSAIDCRVAGCVIALMLTIGCIFFGWLEDKIGTKNNLLISWGGLAIASIYFYGSLSSDMSLTSLYVSYGVFGLFCGAITTTPIVGVRVFPAEIRYSGLSFSYNLAYALFSAITPTLTLSLLRPDYLLGKYFYLGAGIYISFVAVLAVLLGFWPLAQKGYQEAK